MKRLLTLLALAGVGLAVGYLAARGGGAGGPASSPEAPAPTAGSPAGAAGAPLAPPDSAAGGGEDMRSPATGSLLPPARGSSFTVVGAMSRDEMVEHGILPPPPAGQQQAAGTAGEMDGPPAALAFPDGVRAAAGRYWCLCGCGHTLAQCPCNDQPIGAVTMLSLVQRLLDEGRTGAELDAGMVDRYGPRVLVQSDGP